MITKIATDLEQSKRLVEILPNESADMHIFMSGEVPMLGIGNPKWLSYPSMPAWSLSALLNCIPYPTLSKQYNGKWNCTAYPEEETVTNCENAIDAAFELVVLLLKFNVK